MALGVVDGAAVLHTYVSAHRPFLDDDLRPLEAPLLNLHYKWAGETLQGHCVRGGKLLFTIVLRDFRVAGWTLASGNHHFFDAAYAERARALALANQVQRSTGKVGSRSSKGGHAFTCCVCSRHCRVVPETHGLVALVHPDPGAPRPVLDAAVAACAAASDVPEVAAEVGAPLQTLRVPVSTAGLPFTKQMWFKRAVCPPCWDASKGQNVFVLSPSPVVAGSSDVVFAARRCDGSHLMLCIRKFSVHTRAKNRLQGRCVYESARTSVSKRPHRVLAPSVGPTAVQLLQQSQPRQLATHLSHMQDAMLHQPHAAAAAVAAAAAAAAGAGAEAASAEGRADVGAAAVPGGDAQSALSLQYHINNLAAALHWAQTDLNMLQQATMQPLDPRTHVELQQQQHRYDQYIQVIQQQHDMLQQQLRMAMLGVQPQGEGPGPSAVTAAAGQQQQHSQEDAFMEGAHLVQRPLPLHEGLHPPNTVTTMLAPPLAAAAASAAVAAVAAAAAAADLHPHPRSGVPPDAESELPVSKRARYLTAPSDR